MCCFVFPLSLFKFEFSAELLDSKDSAWDFLLLFVGSVSVEHRRASVPACFPVLVMPGRTDAELMEERLVRLEDTVSEWSAVTRVRFEGLVTLKQKAIDLHGGSKEFWRLKMGLAEALWADLGPALQGSDATRVDTMKNELFQCLVSEADIQGVFPVGGDFASCSALDVKCKPSLAALRLHTLARNHLSPLLRQLGGAVRCWVPASAADMKRKRKRAALTPDASSKSKAQPPKSHRQERGHRGSREGRDREGRDRRR